MPKVILSVPIEISSEDEVSKQVLASLPNRRILVFGANLVDSLDELVGPAKFHMRALDNPLAGHQVSRALHVVKSGTRFRVTENNADGINLAEEADLSYKSFSSFGEFVRRTLNGELALGSTPSVPPVYGTITVSLEFSAGTMTAQSNPVEFNGQSTGTSSPDISLVQSTLQNFGTVQVDDPNSGTGWVDFIITLNGNTPTISETGNSLGSWNRTGYSAGTAGNLPNAIYLDQVSGSLAFVRIASIPAGEPLAIVTRDAASETALFE